MIRAGRRARGWTQAQLAAALFCSPTTVSRWETGRAPLRDVTVLRQLCKVLRIPPERLGVAATVPGDLIGKGDDVRRRELLRNFAVTAAASAAPALAGQEATHPDPGDLMVANLRRVLLTPPSTGPVGDESPVGLPGVVAGLVRAKQAFQRCRYEQLAVELPRLMTAGHRLAATGDPAACAALAEVYTLATRMLIKMDSTELGLVAADRTRLIAASSADPVLIAEAARNLSVVTRKAGWHDQAAEIALAAAADPALSGGGAVLRAQRGLLVMCAAYTAAKAGDCGGMRELTAQARAIAVKLGGRVVLPSHGGGFGAPVVDLHLISANNACGDPSAALTVAADIRPGALPTMERRSRFYGDVAASHALLGQRTRCLDALLAAERAAPQEMHARPATRSLVAELLTKGRLTPEIRALAARCGITR